MTGNTRETVIWGSGFRAQRFATTLGIDKVSFFIDIDKFKEGNIIFGKKVVHPDHVKDWRRLFIYVPGNFYEEISEFLHEKGMSEKDFVSYQWQILESESADIEKDITKFLNEINNLKEELYNASFVFVSYEFGAITERNFLLSLWDHLEEEKPPLYCSEVQGVKIEELSFEINGKLIVLPEFASYNTMPNFSLSKETLRNAVREAKTYNYVKNVAENLRYRFENMKKDNEYAYVYYLDYMLRGMIEMLHPKRIMFVCSFTPLHMGIKYIAEEYKIPVVFSHLGVLPGTMVLERFGEVGKSIPSVCCERFKKLMVDKDDVVNAERVCHYIHEKSKNRRIQPKTQWKIKLQNKIKKERPILFFAGNNDATSGVQPYTEEAKTYYSPIFGTSDEAVLYLSELAAKNDWNLIYKRHPFMDQINRSIRALPDNVLYIEQADINELIDFSDLIITIVSTTSYDALIREKPVLTLGYNQLKDKDCVYQAFEKEQIEDVIKKALESGYTEEQRSAFYIHVAQLLKYYLYDDLSEREICYGKSLPSSWEDVDWLYEKLYLS